MTNEEHDALVARESVRTIRAELAKLDSLANLPIPLQEVNQVRNLARNWEAAASRAVSVRASRAIAKPLASEQGSL